MAPPTLARLVIDEIRRGSAHTAAGAGGYVWDFYGDPAGHEAMRWAAAERFVQAQPRASAERIDRSFERGRQSDVGRSSDGH